MIRGILIVIGVALVIFALAVTVARVHVDGITTLAIIGLLIIALANRWHPTTQ